MNVTNEGESVFVFLESLETMSYPRESRWRTPSASKPLYVYQTNFKNMNWSDVIKYANQGSPEPDRRVEKTDKEWRIQLTPEQYRITRQKGTERAFSGALCYAHDPGKYACICCGTLLFDSALKFDSGTGWPSFTEPVKDNVIKYEKDTSYGMVRVEVMCNVCDGHLGHVFPDGPPPSGLRFCINSESIKLVEKETTANQD